MTRRELDILGQAFGAEIGGALTGGPPILQTRSKLAAKLVEAGLLVQGEVTLGGHPPVRLAGYMLTEAGRIAYCATCEAEL